jgi:ATP-dependent helicase/nuclease subunit A
MTQEDKSKARDLKPEQQSAAHTLDRHVSVIAGPGSGKTTVLVERYLNILRHKGASADQIVAITFTNRAANEMRTRLRREVDRILASADQGERRKWLRHKRTLEGAMITTIHGFCSRLLREFPLEAEIDPQFILLDEYQSALLEQTVIDEVVSAEIEGGSDAIAQLALFAGRPALSLMVSKTYGTVRNQGIDLDQSEQETEQYHAKADEYAECVAKLERQMDEFLNAKGLSAGAEAKRCEAAARWPGFRKLIQNPPQLRDAARFCAMLEEFRSHTRPSSSPKVKALVEALDALIWAKDLKGELPLVAFDLFARDYALSLLSLVRKVDERLIQEKQRMSALGYDDLQLLALNLLRSREAVRRRVAARYRFYLIDEFQDTNGLQQEMVNLLALDPRHRANLFIVGDPKQSIYGFRGADVHVFSTVSAQIDSTGGALIPLHANFRSRPQLIHFFNELFRKTFHDCGLSSEELDELGFVPHEDGVAEREDGENIAPLVELHVCEYPKKGNEFSDSDEAVPRELDAAQVAARISDLVAAAGDADGAPSGFRYKEIAVLFRAMTSVGIYESALRRAGIPYRTVAGSGFYQREEVGDLIQLLCFVDNLTDELALASVLRSPLCCVSDNALMALRCGPVG